MQNKCKNKQNIHGRMTRIKHSIVAWAKPYVDPNIDNIHTGLDKQFRYSPVFKNVIADTMVNLTGYRGKDYLIAEQQTGTKHTPKITVWHHVWEEKNGLYRMQLVHFDTHKKTCPHAGGCKLWLIKNNRKGRYLSYRKLNHTGNYTDVTSFYKIDASDRDEFQKGYVSKRTRALIRKKRIELIAVDMYGNLVYANGKGTYFWDHESDKLMLLKNTTNFMYLR